MDENLGLTILFSIGAISVCSFLAVAAWVAARRGEREAYYKSEAIKKIAEIQGTPSEPVMELLQKAVSSWNPPTVPRLPEVARAYYNSETLRKLAETSGGDAVLQHMREQSRQAARRTREGTKLGGMVTMAVGVGLTVFLRAIEPDMPVYLVGLIPLLIGVALLSHFYLSAAEE